MHAELVQLVNAHGFKAVYGELMGIAVEKMSSYAVELNFINSLLEPAGCFVAVPEQPGAACQVPVENVIEPVVVGPVEEVSEPVAEKQGRKIKVIRKNGRMIQVKKGDTIDVSEPVKAAAVVMGQETEAAAVVEQKTEAVAVEGAVEQLQEKPVKRTAKEMKKWQREQEAARRKYMKANNIALADVLKVEVIQSYLNSGATYASIARELTGQKEEEVSKWCKAHGLKKRE